MHDLTTGFGGVLMIFGGLIFVVGGFWFLVRAFTESVLWGLAVMFVPIVSLFFLIVHWHRAKHPFFVQLGGFAVLLLGALFGHQ
jgi:hypothetical protein